MDQPLLPLSLRETLGEILDTSMSYFRGYYDGVARRLQEQLREAPVEAVVELGAGTAPITRRLASTDECAQVRLYVCDLQPNRDEYAALTSEYPGRVFAESAPVDFTVARSWPMNSLLLASGCFHHVRPEKRRQTLAMLLQDERQILIAEPLRKSALAMGFAAFGFIPAMLVPIILLRRRGRMRRVFWCWLFPAAPIMFCWDGIVSCLRQWTDEEWTSTLASLGLGRGQVRISQSLLCQFVSCGLSAHAK